MQSFLLSLLSLALAIDFLGEVRVDLYISIALQLTRFSKNQLTFWKPQEMNDNWPGLSHLLPAKSMSSLKFNVLCIFYIQLFFEKITHHFKCILAIGTGSRFSILLYTSWYSNLSSSSLILSSFFLSIFFSPSISAFSNSIAFSI